MTRPASATTAMEQALFQLDRDGTVTTVVSSFTDADAERGWVGVLAPHIGLAGTAEATHQPALSYLLFSDGLAAVLHRVHEPGGGSTTAHALLGRVNELTATVALSAVDWTGWLSTAVDAMPASTRLTRLRVDEVVVPGATERLRARAIAQGDQLARALAWLLQAPTMPIGIVGCAEADRPALVLALMQIASPVLPSRPWTFATRADTATDAATPAIAFFATPPPDAAGRLLIDMGRDQGASPHNEYRANALVYRYEYGVDPPNVTAAPADLPVPPPAPQRPRPVPVEQPQRSSAVLPQARVAALVRDLATARGVSAVDRALVELEYAVAKIDDRDNLRRALANEDLAGRVISRYVPFDQREAVYVRVASIAFGATSPGRATPGARADARRVVAEAGSADLVRAVVRVSMDGELADLLAKRWLLEHEPVAPDAMAGLGPVARFCRRLGLPVSPAVARLTLFLVVLVLGVALGWWVGGALR